MTDVLITIIAAIAVLGILIFVHELGHFLVAKWSGVRVLRFSIGFGPRMVTKTIGETEYALSAIPLGGYVKMLGEDEDAAEEGVPHDPERSFAAQSLSKRFAIVFAGPAFNLLSAWVFLVISIGAYGMLTASEEPIVGGVVDGHPAAEAGVLAGDRVVELDGETVPTWDALADRIREGDGQPVALRIDRDGEAVEISVTPESVVERNLFGEETGTAYRIGIERNFETVPASWLEAPLLAGRQVALYSELIVLSIVKMVQGKVSARELGGPITIARVAGERAQSGLKGLLEFMAFLGINLGILNLLPIPVLDGGHLFFFAIEAIVRRPIRGRVREMAQQVGLVLLISLMIFAVYNDIARWIQG